MFEYSQKKYCRSCGALIAVYPGPSDLNDPSSPPMTPQRFNPLKRCAACQKAIRQETINGYKRLTRKDKRARNRASRQEAEATKKLLASTLRALDLSRQETALLRQRVQALGGRV